MAVGWVMTVYQHEPTTIKESYYKVRLRLLSSATPLTCMPQLMLHYFGRN